MSRLERAAKILKKLGASAEDIVRKPKHISPDEALENFKKIPDADTPEIVNKAVLKSKWDFPEEVLPTGGKELPSVVEERAKLEKLKDASEDEITKTDIIPDEGSEFAGKNTKSLAGKVLHGLGRPQRELFSFAAKKLGIKSDEDSSENTAFNIIDKAAEKLGVPEDSVVGNMGKAATVALADYFLDPVNYVAPGAGKLSKVAQKSEKINQAAKAVSKVVDTDKIMKLARKAKLEEFLKTVAKRGPSTAEQIRDAGGKVVNTKHFVKSRP